MSQYAKPTVVVSKCLEFDKVRYSGEVLNDLTVKKLMPYVTFIPVCPEVEIGLGVPRETIRIVDISGEQRLIQPATGEDLTERMKGFSETFLNYLPEVDGFIMKNRSPSCGLQDVKVYGDVGPSRTVDRGAGLFGQAVLNKFPGLALEEEGRLKNFKIREHFFTKLFTIAEFRTIKQEKDAKKLIAFQSKHKYLFMMYHQVAQKELGRILALNKTIEIDELFQRYEEQLQYLFAKSPSYTRAINVSQHIYGYFKKNLTQKEKDHFNVLLERFRDKKIPLNTLMTILHSWSIRFNVNYLIDQSIFAPYPEKLVEITDSGKGRDY